MLLSSIRLIFSSLLLLLYSNSIAATANILNGVTFDSMVYDFGDINIEDGPQNCMFTLINSGEIPFSIVSISSSCGCTKANWNKSEIRPGEKCSIEVTYKNSDGPFPFDKTLAVYTSLSNEPYLLHIRGHAHRKSLSPRKMYPFRLGKIGFEKTHYELGLCHREEVILDSLRIYNFSRKECIVSVSSSLLLFKQVKYNIPARKFIYVPFYLRIPSNMIGSYSIPIIVSNDLSKKQSRININLHVIPDLNNRKQTCIKLNNKYISLGQITNKKERLFSVNISNQGEYPLSIYKIDCPPEIITLNEISSIDVDSTKTISFRIINSQQTKKEKVAEVMIYSNSHETIDYIYVSYQIPPKIEAILLKIRHKLIHMHREKRKGSAGYGLGENSQPQKS